MTEKTYEMLWDCAYCGTQKLLGHTQRYCANCGAPQDPSRRYFPPDDAKVAVEDHAFVGADLACPACQQPMSRAAKNCTSCGSPLEADKQVAMRADQVEGQPAPGLPGTGQHGGAAPGGAGAQPKPTKKIGVVIGLVLFAIVALVIARMTMKKDTTLAVSALSWERTIEIERLTEASETKPCTSVPRDANITARKTAPRECKKRKVDQGDGTFKEKENCTEPAEQCTYLAKTWKRERTLRAAGVKGEPPVWPALTLVRSGNCVGCEREGGKKESFTVSFIDSNDKKTRTCTFDTEAKWAGFKPKSKWAATVNMIGGDLDCSTLKKN
ncbi:MAG: hypothetical protein EXR75_06845 [Myxococcales bacterium]|nr:hypothetical protein [Myxococcales bacterium]